MLIDHYQQPLKSPEKLPTATIRAGLHLNQKQLVGLNAGSDRRILEVIAFRQTTIRYSCGTHRVPRFAIGTVSVLRS